MVPEQIVSAANPTPSRGSKARAARRLSPPRLARGRVGLVGPAATAQIPHDTTPPAAPQGLQVAAPATSRVADGFDLRWHNLLDAGSPIDAAHYQVLSAGKVGRCPRRRLGDNVQAIQNLETPGAGRQLHPAPLALRRRGQRRRPGHRAARL